MDQQLKDLRDRMVLKDQLDALAPILPERCYWSHAIQNVDLEALKPCVATTASLLTIIDHIPKETAFPSIPAKGIA